MASNPVPGAIPTLAGTLNQAVQPLAESVRGKPLPPGGNVGATSRAASAMPETSAHARPPAAVNSNTDLQTQLAQLNKHLNDSGRPNQFRVDPSSRNRTIQEINPTTGEVIGEFAASEFPALARSLGVSGVVIDSRA